MFKRLTIYVYCLCIILIANVKDTYAQSSTCPPNIDFSLGDFAHWECRTGGVSGSSGINLLTLPGIGQADDRHQLISPGSNDLDPYGNFPVHRPNSNSFTVRLGNPLGGAAAEALFYTFTIPASVTKFSLLYYYAIVMQNPGHEPHEQPRFRARIIDVVSEAGIVKV